MPTGDRRDRQFTIACHKFNARPESGISYLRQEGLLPEGDAAGVARFLHTAAGLSKKAIGDFLGRRDAFSEEVLVELVRRHDFSGQPLLPSLRRLLEVFHLPGESQKIDRICSCFAKHYCRQNCTEFASVDACAKLCNALLMLNTLLHNPNARGDPPDVDLLAEFAQHEGRPILPRSRLEELYNSISVRPFVVPADGGADDLTLALRRSECSGWLTERRLETGRCLRLGRWQRRWFVLVRQHLAYFASREAHLRDERPLGLLPLVNLRLQVVQDRCKKFCFELCGRLGPVPVSEPGCCRGGKPLMVEAVRLSAESCQDMTQWMLAITTRATEEPPPTPVPQRHRPADTGCSAAMCSTDEQLEGPEN